MQGVPELLSSADSGPLQPLLDTAHRAAAEGATGLEANICSLMDALTPVALSIWPPIAAEPSAVPPVIRTQLVYEDSDVELVVFLFPAGACIPLHDHPHMSVFSKVLYGSLATTSYDWEEPLTHRELDSLSAELERLESQTEDPGPPLAPPRAAVCRASAVLTPASPTSSLGPCAGNIHTFQAREACAVIDLLMPPYDDGRHRGCHYFELCEKGTVAPPAPGARVSLRVVAPPPSLVIRSAIYRGPRVVPSALRVSQTVSKEGAEAAGDAQPRIQEHLVTHERKCGVS